MGMFINGKLKIDVVNPTTSGAFERLPTTFRHQISSDGPFKPESGRYRDYFTRMPMGASYNDFQKHQTIRISYSNCSCESVYVGLWLGF